MFILALLSFSILSPNLFADPASFEAITGESIEDDHSVWDSFYSKKDHAFGREAVGFLKENLKTLRRGRAFVPAMGEGRNAIFLARNGFEVDGVDLSSVAVDRAMAEARNQKVRLKGLVADLNQVHYQKDTYDLVFVSLFYSAPLITKFRQALKKGGTLMLYLKSDLGKPSQKVSPDDFLVKASELKPLLDGMNVMIFREYRDHDVDVIGVLAQKP